LNYIIEENENIFKNINELKSTIKFIYNQIYDKLNKPIEEKLMILEENVIKKKKEMIIV